MGSDKLDILKVGVMLPETIQNQCCLILLNGQLRSPLSVNPGLPATTPGAIGIIFMQQVSIIRKYTGTEIVKAARRLNISGMTERIGYQGTIARPHIRIAIVIETFNIAVISRDDGPSTVDLRT